MLKGAKEKGENGEHKIETKLKQKMEGHHKEGTPLH
jgi:hypothetical protein